MKKIFGPFALSLCLAAVHAHAALEATGIKVYTGDHGVEVAIVQIKEPNKFLIQVKGTGASFDGLVLPYLLDPVRESYSTTYRGQPYNFVISERLWGDEVGFLVLYVPGDVRTRRPLGYNEARSRSAKVADLLALHKKQWKNGSIARFGRFDRPMEQASHDKSLAEAVAAFAEACGIRIRASIVWSSIGDDLIKDLSIASFCSAPLSALGTVCRSNDGRASVAAKVKEVRCRFGAAMKVDLDDMGVLMWTTSKDGSNQEDFITKQWLSLDLVKRAAKPTSGGR
jgi:hypothetical protein